MRTAGKEISFGSNQSISILNLLYNRSRHLRRERSVRVTSKLLPLPDARDKNSQYVRRTGPHFKSHLPAFCRAHNFPQFWPHEKQTLRVDKRGVAGPYYNIKNVFIFPISLLFTFVPCVRKENDTIEERFQKRQFNPVYLYTDHETCFGKFGNKSEFKLGHLQFNTKKKTCLYTKYSLNAPQCYWRL